MKKKISSVPVLGPFDSETDITGVSNNGERYVPLVDPYNAAMSLGHMAAYKHALCYAYGRRVLDIGCGTGYGALYLASFGASEVVALDIDPVALDYACIAYAHPRVHYQCSDGNRLPFDDATFEFVVSSQVIEHITNPMHFLAEIKRVLKPGGFCLITTPNRDLFSLNLTERSSEFHLNEMSLDQFKALGCAVFPGVEMVGIPQNSLVRQPDNTILLKENKLLCLEDYQVRRDDLNHCENILLFGHTQANGEFSATLPDSLSPASNNLGPYFWDANTGHWIELSLYPDNDSTDGQGIRDEQTVKQIFRSKRENLFRIDVALKQKGDMPIEAELRDPSRSDQRLVRVVVYPENGKLSLVFKPIADSAGHEFCLELRPRRRLMDILLNRKNIPPRFEYRSGQLAFWTFHQTLPASIQ